MPYLKLTTGDILPISEDFYRRLLKRNRMNPAGWYKDDATGMGIAEAHIVAVSQEGFGFEDEKGNLIEEKRRGPGRPPKKEKME